MLLTLKSKHLLRNIYFSNNEYQILLLINVQFMKEPFILSHFGKPFAGLLKRGE